MFLCVVSDLANWHDCHRHATVVDDIIAEIQLNFDYVGVEQRECLSIVLLLSILNIRHRFVEHIAESFIVYVYEFKNTAGAISMILFEFLRSPEQFLREEKENIICLAFCFRAEAAKMTNVAPRQQGKEEREVKTRDWMTEGTLIEHLRME